VRKFKGFESLGLPDSELSVTLTFITEGIDIKKLKQVELNYIQRFTNPNDADAQAWLEQAVSTDQVEAERQNLLRNGQPKTMWEDNDYIDMSCSALSIAYHAYRGNSIYLSESNPVFDRANIAKLPGGRLSWNALLFDVDAEQAEALASDRATPTAAMMDEMDRLAEWFKSLDIGVTDVVPAKELYIRHAGNVVDVVEPLSGADMLAGGVSAAEAFGTFGYHFDVRGGISGLGERAQQKGYDNLKSMEPVPLFNVGMQHALVSTVRNLAVVSPASGFTGIAASTGRIVEFNCGVGQGVGIAAGIALAENRNLADISNAEVREVLSSSSNPPTVYGRAANDADTDSLREFETLLGASEVAELRAA
jgi:hypothetical protein